MKDKYSVLWFCPDLNSTKIKQLKSYIYSGAKVFLLSYDDLEVENAYNTYRNDGLPPGPIANSGEKALVAAIEPDKHSYLYYVTKKDGTGEHYFAETFEEHRKYKALSVEKQSSNSRR